MALDSTVFEDFKEGREIMEDVVISVRGHAGKKMKGERFVETMEKWKPRDTEQLKLQNAHSRMDEWLVRRTLLGVSNLFGRCRWLEWMLAKESR